jgi:hypothetical protein
MRQLGELSRCLNDNLIKFDYREEKKEEKDERGKGNKQVQKSVII